jgi:hypothetical protein
MPKTTHQPAAHLAVAALAALSITFGLAAPAACADTATAPPLAHTDSPVAAAIMVGGTTYPTVSASLMEQLWPVWSTNLGLTNSTPELISVTYPAQLWPFNGALTLGNSVAAGVTSLLNLVNITYAAGERLIVWGISQGSLVIDQTQTLLTASHGAPPPDAITFVRVADPAAALTGVLNHLPEQFLSTLLHYPTSARTAPSDSQYDTVVVTNEYDGFADFPDRPGNLLAVANAVMGLFYRHGQTSTATLTEVPAHDISTTVNALGATTTTYLIPCEFLPLTQPLIELGVSPDAVDKLNARLRPVIDSAYSRNDSPTSLPAPATADPVTAGSRRTANRTTVTVADHTLTPPVAKTSIPQSRRSHQPDRRNTTTPPRSGTRTHR